MQSRHPNAVSPNLRSITKAYADLRPSQLVKVDTRPFAGMFPGESLEAVSDCGDASDEEQYGGSDNLSQSSGFVTAFEKSASSSIQIASTPSADESSTLSAAQQIVARYRAAHDSDSEPERATAEINEKELPQIPDDQRSIYTLAPPVDPQVTMDMMWRPKPKVHMRHADQLALVQAQRQAIAMMENAGLKPTDKIQCRRQGCTDILEDIQALKYHLHIHNIADGPAACIDASSFSSCRPSLHGYSFISHPKPLKRTHLRSKSSVRTQPKGSKAITSPRTHLAGSPLPLDPSPRESIQEAQRVLGLSSITRAFSPGHSPSKSAGSPPVYNSQRSAHSRTPSRGRRMTKESAAASIGADHPSIAMLLSRPPSPIMHGRLVPTPPSNMLMSFALNPGMEGENENNFPTENAFSVPEKLTRSRSPFRALSPTRAMSPVRDGIRRVFSFGYSVEPTNE